MADSADPAYMALALHNAQSELSDFEVGLYALRPSLSVREYVARCGSGERNLLYQVHAA